MPNDPLARLFVGLVLYTVVSVFVRHPSLTPLDFLEATAATYLLLQVTVAIFILAILAPLPVISVRAFAWGYVAGLAFVASPHLVGIARRECIHQFEIRNLYRLSSILPRELLLCGVTFPAIAACEEVVFRGILEVPEPAVAVAQWLVYWAGSRSGVSGPALSCAFVAALHQRTGLLGAVIGAHAAIQTLTGRLRSPGLFGRVYPLLEQAKWRDLGPAWRKTAVELAVGAVLVWLAS